MKLVSIVVAATALSLTCSAFAERADRQKPVHIEADRMMIDDLKKVQILEGNVILNQGTMQLRAERIVVTQDESGFQRGIATSGKDGLARYREKRERSNDFVEGEAERIEYDAKTEQTQFFKRAWIKSGGDEVRGDYISYDALTEKYNVKNSGDSGVKGNPNESRVKMIIQPKTKGAEDKTTPSIPLKSSQTIKSK